MRAGLLRVALPALVALLALATRLQAGTYEDPEVKDARLDEATEPVSAPMCPAQQCPPSFTTFPGDIEEAWIGPETDDALQMNMQINGSAASGPSSTYVWTWTLHWSLAGSPGSASATMLSNGELRCGGLATACVVNASSEPSSRILQLLVPRTALGDPPAKAVLADLWVESHGRPQASPDAAAGATDRAPNSGYGSDYTMTGRAPAAKPVLVENVSAPAPPPAPSGGGKSSPGPTPALLVLAVGLAAVLRRQAR
jgi:hypothetical protein